jgi:Secretion system C-terminal sorting domain
VVDYTLTGITITDGAGTPTSGGVIDLSNPGSPIPVSFSYGGDYQIHGVYETNTLYTDAHSTTPHRHKADRWIVVHVADVSGVTTASLFTLNVNNNCPAPLTSVTVNRSYPGNTLWGYEVKLFEINGAVRTQRWASGYFNNGANFTTMNIGTAQYNGFSIGKTYQVEVFAKPQNYSGCGPDGSYYTQNFTVSPTPVTPSFTLTGGKKVGDFYQINLCETFAPINLNNTSTFPTCAPITGVKFRYRQLLYGSSTAPMMYGSEPGIETAWQTPALSYNLRNIITNMDANGFFTVDMQVQTALGISGWTNRQLVQIQKAPPANIGLVDFGFNGSPDADAYVATTLCTNAADGELFVTPTTTSCDNNDGRLSNGGTDANPTWVGASQTILYGLAATNIFGGMQSHKVEIWDLSYSGTTPIGTYIGGSTFVIPFNINSRIPCAYTGVPATYFFTSKMSANGNVFVGHKFKITLTATDICGKPSSKTGYFQMIPNQAFWRKTGLEGTDIAEKISSEKQYLLVSPNPVQNQINIQFDALQEGEGVLSIISVDGKATERKITLVTGENTFKENIENLPNGVYFVRLQQNDSVLSQKFIKID